MIALKVILWIICAILILFAAYFVFLYIASLFVDGKKLYDKNSKFYRFLLNFSTAAAMKIVRIKTVCVGFENIPHDARFLLVGNHRSKFDPILTWYLLRKYDIAFISKPENFKVPFFGKIIRKCCFMPIDRENPRNAIETINRASQLIKNDEVSIGVYPEGTRSMNNELLPFHDGVFRIAQKAYAPVVVLTVRGTEKIKKNYPFHKTTVYFDVSAVYDKDTVKRTRTSELGAQIYNLMDETIKKGDVLN